MMNFLKNPINKLGMVAPFFCSPQVSMVIYSKDIGKNKPKLIKKSISGRGGLGSGFAPGARS